MLDNQKDIEANHWPVKCKQTARFILRTDQIKTYFC